VAGTKKCEIPVEAQCKVASDCDDVFPIGSASKCLTNECTCDKSSGQCYRACQEDLDCPAKYACDTKTSLCEAEPGCATDAECVLQNNDIRQKCTDGQCAAACDNDLDCNGGRLTNGELTMVCNADKRCEAVGCQTDSDCGSTEFGLRIFCGEKAPAPAVGSITGAITD
jgi:hypothetical protein